MAKNAKLAGLPGTKSTPSKPDYVPQETWDAADDTQKAYMSDPANEKEIREAFAPDDGGTPQGETADPGERVSVAISDADIPTSYQSETDKLASVITEAQREAFIDVVDMEMKAKARSVSLYTIIVAAYGEGAASLPRYGTTAETSNHPDIFKYRKKTSKGVRAKSDSEGSVLEITAYKAMISAGLHNQIKDLEKKISGLGKGAQVPEAWSTALDVARDKRNKLIKKFVFAVRLVHVLADISAMTSVGWLWIAEDGSNDVNDDLSNLTLANTSILVFAKNKDGTRGGMSAAIAPGTIVDWRPQWANDNKDKFPNLFEALLASVEAPTPEQTEGEAEVKIESFDTLDRILSGTYEYLKKFAGPSASKADATVLNTRLLSDAGASTLANIFALVEMLEESVTSKDVFRSKEQANRTRIERAQGGDANRQVKQVA